MRRSFATTGLMLALAACRSAETPSSSVAIPSTPVASATSMRLEGTYVHPGSGISFPEKAAGFTRVEPKSYDREGNDVGIGYRRIWYDGALLFRAEVTVFVFPWAKTGAATSDDVFVGEASEIAARQEDVRGIRDVRSSSRHGDHDVLVRAAEYAFRGDERMGRLPMLALLAAFNDGPWRVTVRAPLPPPRRDECVAALDLPPTGLPATTR